LSGTLCLLCKGMPQNVLENLDGFLGTVLMVIVGWDELIQYDIELNRVVKSSEH
jgi:hypothetical protein